MNATLLTRLARPWPGLLIASIAAGQTPVPPRGPAPPPARLEPARWAMVVGTHNDFYPYMENTSFETGGGPSGPKSWVFNGSMGCFGSGNPICCVTPMWDTTGAFATTGIASAGIEIAQTQPSPSCECFGFWQQGSGNGKPISVIGGAQYTLSARILTQNVPVPGQGAFVEVVWYDRNGRWLRTDPSARVAPAAWQQVFALDSVTGQQVIVAPATAATSDVNLWLFSGTVGPNVPCPQAPAPARAWFDDVQFTTLGNDADAMPGDALVFYEMLKEHGYGDARTTLMLYHAGDNDVRRAFGGPNLLLGPDGVVATGDEPAIDYENANVTEANFKAAMTALADDVASTRAWKKEVVLYVSSHGVRQPTDDDPAEFAFEAAGGGAIDEDELATEIAKIPADARVTVVLDFCYSGNFLDSLSDGRTIAVTASDEGLSYLFPETYDAKYFANAFSNVPLSGIDTRFVEMYGVGSGGAIYELSDTGIAQSFFGTTLFNDIAFRPPGKEYALVVGNGGYVGKFDPVANTLVPLASGVTNDLLAVDFTSDGRYAIVVGRGGRVLWYKAATQTLTLLSGGGSFDWYDVACRMVYRPVQGGADSYYDATVVGASGRVETWRGWRNAYTSTEDFAFHHGCSPTNATLRGVSWSYDTDWQSPYSGLPPAPDPDWSWGTLLAVGNSGTILRASGSNGCTFTLVPGPPAVETLEDVQWRDWMGHALIVGRGAAGSAAAYGTDGTNVQPLATPLDHSLYACAWDPSQPYAYAVGAIYPDAGAGKVTWMEYLVHFSGSFFEEPFVGALDDGLALRGAFNSARAFVPALVGSQAGQTVLQIQDPQLQDDLGDAAGFRIF